jgi:aromatic-L-amino-acid decarboxylase
VLPGITHWNHPGFFAYFAITGSAPGILGALLAAGLNVNAMLWKTSPAATELEQVTLGWLRQMLGLPAFGVSRHGLVSTLTALARRGRPARPAAWRRARRLPGLRVAPSRPLPHREGGSSGDRPGSQDPDRRGSGWTSTRSSARSPRTAGGWRRSRAATVGTTATTA